MAKMRILFILLFLSFSGASTAEPTFDIKKATESANKKCKTYTFEWKNKKLCIYYKSFISEKYFLEVYPGEVEDTNTLLWISMRLNDKGLKKVRQLNKHDYLVLFIDGNPITYRKAPFEVFRDTIGFYGVKNYELSINSSKKFNESRQP